MDQHLEVLFYVPTRFPKFYDDDKLKDKPSFLILGCANT